MASTAPIAAVLAICTAALSASYALAQQAPAPAASSLPDEKAEAEFQAMLAKYDAAQVEFHGGRPAAVKALWSHADDVTLAGGAGGTIEKGWPNVGRRLDWASAQYSRGEQTNERIQAAVRGDFAYAVQLEHISFYPPGGAAPSKRDYRVTTIFRREPEGWRVVHRQADTMMVRQTPR